MSIETHNQEAIDECNYKISNYCSQIDNLNNEINGLNEKVNRLIDAKNKLKSLKNDADSLKRNAEKIFNLPDDWKGNRRDAFFNDGRQTLSDAYSQYAGNLDYIIEELQEKINNYNSEISCKQGNVSSMAFEVGVLEAKRLALSI